jgi:hypothetical protein
MTLKDAKALRDYIIDKSGVNCTVPLGHGPSNYFPMSVLGTGPHQWQSRQEFRDWWAGRLRERRNTLRQYDRLVRQRQRPRSPIEMMIDNACGLT